MPWPGHNDLRRPTIGGCGCLLKLGLAIAFSDIADSSSRRPLTRLGESVPGAGSPPDCISSTLLRLQVLANGLLPESDGLPRAPLQVPRRHRHRTTIGDRGPCAPQFCQPLVNVGRLGISRKLHERLAGIPASHRCSVWLRRWHSDLCESRQGLLRSPACVLQAVIKFARGPRSPGRFLCQLEPASCGFCSALRSHAAEASLKVTFHPSDRLHDGDGPHNFVQRPGRPRHSMHTPTIGRVVPC